MSTVSNKKQVEMLETGVLENDIAAVEKLIKEYAPFEFTNRALGFACRYCGIDMVKALTSNGADFDTEDIEFFSGKYGTETHPSSDAAGHHGFVADYSLMLVLNDLTDDRRVGIITRGLGKDYTDEYFANREIISESDRVGIIDYLINIGALQGVQLESLLYHAIMNNCNDISAYLQNRGVSITKQKTENTWDYEYRHQLENPHRRYYDALVIGANNYERIEFKNYLEKNNDQSNVAALKSLIVLFRNSGDKIKISKNIFNVLPDGILTEEYWGELDTSSLSVTDMFERIISTNNIPFLILLLKQGYFSNYSLIEKAINKASKAGSTEIQSILMDYVDKNINVEKVRKQKLSRENAKLNEKTPLAKLKEMWGFKKLEDGTLLISSYKGEELDVVIPDAIGKNVVSAFSRQTFSTYAPGISDKRVNIRKSITRITISGNCSEIPSGAFCRNDALSEIIIHEGVKTICERAFSGCERISTLKLPASITSIGEEAFSQCKLLQDIVVDSNNKYYCDIDGVLFSKDRKKLIYYPINRAGEYYEVPEGVTEINSRAFEDSHLCTIKLPNTLRKIGMYAFRACRQLKDITIPESVTTIDGYLFLGCQKITKIVIPENVKHYDETTGEMIKEIVFLGKETTTDGYGFEEGITLIAPVPSKIQEFCLQHKRFKFQELVDETVS